MSKKYDIVKLKFKTDQAWTSKKKKRGGIKCLGVVSIYCRPVVVMIMKKRKKDIS